MIDFGESVRLRSLDVSDLEQLFLWRNSYGVRRWCRQHGLLNWDNHRAWFDSLAHDKNTLMYGIVAKDMSDQLVGVCGLTYISWIDRRAEFSLYIGPEHQKHGFARAALKTLTWHGFQNIGLHHIFGESFDDNPAQELFVDVGYKLGGYNPEFYWKDGKFIGATRFHAIANKWPFKEQK